MKTLKHEEVDASAYRDLAHASAAIGEFIETACNRQRLHSALAHPSPVEFGSNQPRAAARQPGAVTQRSRPWFSASPKGFSSQDLYVREMLEPVSIPDNSQSDRVPAIFRDLTA